MAHPLAQYRDEHKLTQQDLADRLGVSRGLISLIEIGEREIQWAQAQKWEAILGISREKLAPDIYGRKPSAAGETGAAKNKATA